MSGSPSPALLTRRQFWAMNLAIGAIVGLLSFGYNHLDDLARGHATPFAEPLIEELTGSYGVVVLVPLIIACARRFRLEPGRWLPRLPVHLAAILAFSAAHTTWNWATRAVLFPLLGLGRYDYGIMPVRYAMELPIDVIIYALVAGITHLVDRYHAARQRELQASRLQAQLARAELQNLQAQLHPHFLYNALNTISSVMYENVEAADRLVSRLSELLRRALQAGRHAEVPLASELEALELYLELMRARFGERLQASVEADAALATALVPPFVLQPLVENAVHHGAPPPPEPARIRIRAARAGEVLRLEVEDNGPGVAHDAALLGRGIGLTNTAERLAALYGDRQALRWRNAPAGGLIVTLELPLRAAAVPLAPLMGERWTASAR